MRLKISKSSIFEEVSAQTYEADSPPWSKEEGTIDEISAGRIQAKLHDEFGMC